MDPYALFDEAENQKRRLASAGHAPCLVKMSQLTAETVQDLIGFGDIVPLKTFMGLPVTIDAALPYLAVRVLGEMK